ncbi:MAG: hypothetical protein BWY31_02554 [Lentisphaerae bacterium ADurb.Bin242]|nr:MAG: hypothetical protein BWY31_02554 [Lentisphaerae bacterium ADurb.Bin242]
MWKKLMIAGLFVGAGMTYAEELTAHWDFTKGSLNSMDGRFKAAVRGATQIAGDEKEGKYLAVGMSRQEKPEGIVLAEKYPALSPGGGFRLEAKIRLREQTSSQVNLVIWDSKYIFYFPKKDNPSYHHGIAFFLIRAQNDLFRPAACIGHGGNSDMFTGAPVKLEEGKIHTVSFEYDGVRQGTFRVDGAVNQVVKAKVGGAVSPAVYNTVIGDRVGSTYNHFDGDIFEVKLYTFPKTEKK